jgi:hypothetical protein
VDGAWGTFIAAALTDGVGVSLVSYVNISYYHGSTVFITPSGRARNISTPRATPIVDAILSHTTSQIVASQRRRNKAA